MIVAPINLRGISRLGLIQAEKSPETSTLLKAYLLLFLKVQVLSRRDCYPTSTCVWRCLFLLRGLPRETQPHGKILSISRRDDFTGLSASVSSFCLSLSPRASVVLVGFTRHEIGRPNKANCRTFLAGWRRRRENEGVATPLRAFACFSAVTLPWQSTRTRCCYRCQGSRVSSARGSNRSSTSEFSFIPRSLSSNERCTLLSNDRCQIAPAQAPYILEGYSQGIVIDNTLYLITRPNLRDVIGRFWR